MLNHFCFYFCAGVRNSLDSVHSMGHSSSFFVPLLTLNNNICFCQSFSESRTSVWELVKFFFLVFSVIFMNGTSLQPARRLTVYGILGASFILIYYSQDAHSFRTRGIHNVYECHLRLFPGDTTVWWIRHGKLVNSTSWKKYDRFKICIWINVSLIWCLLPHLVP